MNDELLLLLILFCFLLGSYSTLHYCGILVFRWYCCLMLSIMIIKFSEEYHDKVDDDHRLAA